MAAALPRTRLAGQAADGTGAQSLSRFLGPAHWPTWLFVGWLWLTAQLPWRIAVGLHEVLGQVLWLLLPGRRRIVARNLELCFPRTPARQRKTLARRHFASVGASVAEIALAWFGTASWSRPPVHVEGVEHLHTALARGTGVILCAGHFTTLELATQSLKPLVPLFAFMYRPRHNALLDEIQSRRRQRTAHVSISNTASRAMLRLLRRNAVVWHAADQVHCGNSTELLPFFGEPAMTSTSTARLARLSGAAVVPIRFRRLDDGTGYVVRIEQALVDVPSDDATADTRRLTEVLEESILECPEQYFWTHRRFAHRGEGLPEAYARTVRPKARPARWRELLAAPLLIASVALFIVAADNDSFWQATWRATSSDEHRFALLATLFALVFCTLTTMLSLALGTMLLRAVSVLLLLVAASCGYFMTQYGVVIDQPMIRNAAETTMLEATPLLGPAYFWHLFLYGMLPSGVVLFMPVARLRWRAEAAVRGGVATASIALLAATLYVNYAEAAFFGREHDDLRLKINPTYPLYAAASFGLASADEAKAPEPLNLRRTALALGKPALIVIVMGETARADRFAFNGYERDTNRYTRERAVVNFPRVVACGTSTAESLPCLFSGLGRAHFSHAAAMAHESLIRAMQRLGVDTFWRDNSTGCKSVCDEPHFEQRANWTHPKLCDATGCFDEVLLENFDELLADRSRDHIVVLHQRGSHGPAYHTDVPQWAKEFLPECDLPNLRNCDHAAINNSYDNTILYTDYFLGRVIDELEQYSDEFDTAMLYVSDHGESLGENGFYLHGFPYAMAPRKQIEVPMLWWASPGFYSHRARISPECLEHTALRPTSHDAVFHTLLPLLAFESPLYDRDLDLFSTCRTEGPMTTAAAIPARSGSSLQP